MHAKPCSPAPRPRLLIVGCGDVGMRILPLVRAAWSVRVLTSSPQRAAVLRAAGALPLVGDLDQPATLARLGGIADAVLHLAPPQPKGNEDLRTRALVRALARRVAVRRFVYVSTTGVYGDVGGARFDETRPVAPFNDRARRRVDAERLLRAWARAACVRLCILRAPGIYAGDREGGHPRERLQRGTPVLARGEDVYSNHIHADDLARACVAALYRAPPQRVFNACDSSELLVGDYYDLAADLCGLPRPPRLARAEAEAQLSAQQMSFLSESRRLDNRRLREELRLVLRYPTVAQGLAQGRHGPHRPHDSRG
ncbi:MAG: SDR family oxidoreductase [Burkholderiales bacterium]|nr:SDR family oxidoreductase [Burkholderiales bacterium]